MAQVSKGSCSLGLLPRRQPSAVSLILPWFLMSSNAFHIAQAHRKQGDAPRAAGRWHWVSLCTAAAGLLTSVILLFLDSSKAPVFKVVLAGLSAVQLVTVAKKEQN